MNVGNAVSAVFVASVLVGCSTPQSPYRDPGEVRGRTVDFTTYDFQQCANTLTDDLLRDPVLTRKIKRSFGADEIPLVAVRFENLTYQHEATDKLKDVLIETIKTRLQKSGRFEFMDRRAESLIVKDWTDEKDGVIVAEGASAPLKDARGADYILHAQLNEFREGEGRVHDVYYKMSAQLVNKKTKLVDWIGEKEIRKVNERPVVGW